MNAKEEHAPPVAVLGASGLIGETVARGLLQAGFPVVAVARRFTSAQRESFGETALEAKIVGCDAPTIAELLAHHHIAIVVNCIGLLQDSGAESADAVHRTFVAQLLAAMQSQEKTPLLVHLSIPGEAADDATAFSLTKREGERLTAASTVPFAILRPGFVIASAAYGGSALIRALGAMPFRLPKPESDRPFVVTDVADIVRTIAFVVRRRQAGAGGERFVWDVMARDASTVGEVIEAFRKRIGGPRPIATLPSWLLDMGAWIGDVSAQLGWKPSIRGTALREMRRGVTGNPNDWIVATGIAPASCDEVFARMPATVQEKWFAHLYLLKPAIIATLAAFWTLTGLIAIAESFSRAAAILTSHAIAAAFARALVFTTSLGDIGIGVAIAFRKTCGMGLLAGIVLAMCYMLGATWIAPDLWFDPLGPLVKTVPAVMLMVVALAILNDR